jgi:transposase
MAPTKMRSWTDKHREWVMQLKFEQRALEETLTDYATEVDHQRERVARLERAIDEAVDKVPRSMRAVIDALQSLRGVSKLTATTIVAEVGELSRFDRAAQLMGYSGAVPASTRVAARRVAAESPRPATVIFAGCSSKPRGPTGIGRGSTAPYDRAKKTSRSP